MDVGRAGLGLAVAGALAAPGDEYEDAAGGDRNEYQKGDEAGDGAAAPGLFVRRAGDELRQRRLHIVRMRGECLLAGIGRERAQFVAYDQRVAALLADLPAERDQRAAGAALDRARGQDRDVRRRLADLTSQRGCVEEIGELGARVDVDRVGLERARGLGHLRDRDGRKGEESHERGEDRPHQPSRTALSRPASSVSFFSSRPLTTGISIRAVIPPAWASSVWVRVVPPPLGVSS